MPSGCSVAPHRPGRGQEEKEKRGCRELNPGVGTAPAQEIVCITLVECPLWWRVGRSCLAAEAVEGAALALEGVHDVHGGHGLAAGVLSVGHGVTDHVLEEHLEDRAGLLVDEPRDALHTATASQTADRGLGDALDVVAQHLAVTLRATFAEALAALSASGHALLEMESVWLSRAGF